jgi:hypothetical protein
LYLISEKTKGVKTIDKTNRSLDSRPLLKQIEKGTEKAKARALAKNANASPKEVAAAIAKEPVSSSRIELTPEAKLIADNFRANR